jgi:hypothetical protein
MKKTLRAEKKIFKLSSTQHKVGEFNIEQAVME